MATPREIQALQVLAHQSGSPDAVAGSLRITAEAAATLLQAMEAQGFVEYIGSAHSGHMPELSTVGYYRITDAGTALLP